MTASQITAEQDDGMQDDGGFLTDEDRFAASLPLALIARTLREGLDRSTDQQLPEAMKAALDRLARIPFLRRQGEHAPGEG